jgi:hypothetical protein
MAKRIIRITEAELGDLIIKNMIGNDPSKMLDNILGAALKYKGKSTNADVSKNLDTTSLEKPSVTTQSPNNSTNFSKSIETIIDNLEGGYYHPNMKNRGQGNFSAMGNSGETMFGMDRLHGNQEKTNDGRQFWSLIDAENASTRWKYNYKLQDNPKLARVLKALVAQIMEPLYNNYMNRYFKTDEARNIVKSNPALNFNFIYATWNGPGHFKKWAKALEDKIKTEKNPQELIKFVTQLRRQGPGTIASTAGKINNIMNNLA